MGAKGPADRHSTRRNPDTGRVKVDVSNTAFWEGLEYRISEEVLGLAQGARLVFKFSCSRDFILQKQSLSCDAGGLRLRAYRIDQGTPSGTFGTPVAIYKKNGMTFIPIVDNVATITTGGDFTPAALPAGKAVETIRVKTSGATSQQATVEGAVGDERGLPPADYYLVIDNIANSGASDGVYDLAWEERFSE